jgi:hypothetical protein
VSGATAGDPADCPPFDGWDETANGGGDAGDLPETAQSTGGDPITKIRGTIGGANDVDVYAIYISDPEPSARPPSAALRWTPRSGCSTRTVKAWCITKTTLTPPLDSSRASTTAPSASRSLGVTIWQLACSVAERRAAARG